MMMEDTVPRVTVCYPPRNLRLLLSKPKDFKSLISVIINLLEINPSHFHVDCYVNKGILFPANYYLLRDNDLVVVQLEERKKRKRNSNRRERAFSPFQSSEEENQEENQVIEFIPQSPVKKSKQETRANNRAEEVKNQPKQNKKQQTLSFKEFEPLNELEEIIFNKEVPLSQSDLNASSTPPQNSIANRRVLKASLTKKSPSPKSNQTQNKEQSNEEIDENEEEENPTSNQIPTHSPLLIPSKKKEKVVGKKKDKVVEDVEEEDWEPSRETNDNNFDFGACDKEVEEQVFEENVLLNNVNATRSLPSSPIQTPKKNENNKVTSQTTSYMKQTKPASNNNKIDKEEEIGKKTNKVSLKKVSDIGPKKKKSVKFHLEEDEEDSIVEDSFEEEEEERKKYYPPLVESEEEGEDNEMHTSSSQEDAEEQKTSTSSATASVSLRRKDKLKGKEEEFEEEEEEGGLHVGANLEEEDNEEEEEEPSLRETRISDFCLKKQTSPNKETEKEDAIGDNRLFPLVPPTPIKFLINKQPPVSFTGKELSHKIPFMKWQDLRTLCVKLGVKCKGKKDQIVNKLLNRVSNKKENSF